MDMLSISSSQARSPFCFKSTTIVHLTQDLKSSLYEQLLALTPTVMKCFKKLVMNQVIPPNWSGPTLFHLTLTRDLLTYGVKTQQHLRSLCRLKKVDLPSFTIFYRNTTEQIFTHCIYSCFWNTVTEERHKLSRAVHTAEEITATSSGPLYWCVGATQSVW